MTTRTFPCHLMSSSSASLRAASTPMYGASRRGTPTPSSLRSPRRTPLVLGKSPAAAHIWKHTMCDLPCDLHHFASLLSDMASASTSIGNLSCEVRCPHVRKVTKMGSRAAVAVRVARRDPTDAFPSYPCASSPTIHSSPPFESA